MREVVSPTKHITYIIHFLTHLCNRKELCCSIIIHQVLGGDSTEKCVRVICFLMVSYTLLTTSIWFVLLRKLLTKRVEWSRKFNLVGCERAMHELEEGSWLLVAESMQSVEP